MKTTWVVAAKGPFALDLPDVDGLNVGMGLLAADGDGTSLSHNLLGTPPDVGWVVSVDRINNRVQVSSDPNKPPLTPLSWLTVPVIWLHYEPCIPRKHPTRNAYVITKCECGVDKAGVGGLHSDWCPKAGGT